MKKVSALLLAIVLVLSTLQLVFAASGDIAGNIYSTDIKACINGVWVDSYNIGGKTVVIAEDITDQFRYYDSLRMLVIDDLAPDHLVSGKETSDAKSGNIIGSIYETDIKTYYRGKELTSYSLNGKMAIVIEELGDDNSFSETGGRFVWNSADRTITLETMYRYPYSMRTMLEDKGYNIVLTESENAFVATPAKAPLTGGYILCEKVIPQNSMIPVTYNSEIIGYKCMFPEMVVETDENGTHQKLEIQVPVEFFYTDKVENMIAEAGTVIPTTDDWLNYFKNHTLSTLKDSFETDEYLFLYMFFANTHGGSDGLIKINKKDGTRIDYDKSFKSVSYDGNKDFADVRIDREAEKVYLHYDVDYVIDLKTDKIEPLTKGGSLLLIETRPVTEKAAGDKILLTDKKEHTAEAAGFFFVKYTPDTVSTCGDAEYFSGSLHNNGSEYEVILDFSDSAGSGKLFQIFRDLSSGNQAVPIHNEEEKYNLINEKIKISVNGQLSRKIAIKSVSWKDSSTVYLYIRDIEPLPLNEITEFYIGLNA